MPQPEYEGVEDLKSFTPEGLYAYRQMLLQKTDEMGLLIQRTLADISKPRVLEIGSGNGRLLIWLANVGMQGIGFEISKSRVAFAEAWAETYGVRNVVFVNKNVLTHAPPLSAGDRQDLVVCITGCFNYFDRYHAPRLLKWMRATGKMSLFELYKEPRGWQKWVKLAPEDPWMYLLDDYVHNDGGVEHTKTFIGRDGQVDVRHETLYYYTVGEFLEMAREVGFRVLVHIDDETERFTVILG